MNKTSATISLAMSALGLFVGYAANRHVSGDFKTANATSISKTEKRSFHETTATGNADTTQLPKTRSAETLETMIDRGENATYAGLALWMLDASATDIAAYWEFRKNGKFDGDMKRLLFINWTRLDPHAAISAVAGTNDASIPWWAWAADDPKAALAAASGEQMKHVARGIGEFQSEWLREHFEQIPKEYQQEALNGLMTWKEDDDHVATLDFLKKQGIGFPAHLFKTLARKDPWAAFDWLQKNDKLDPRDNGPVRILLDVMQSAHPEDLERLAAIAPSVALKQQIEDSIFENLLATDPDAALARAKATDAPLVAARRLAKIGASLLASDPEKAFEIGADILTLCPEKLAPERRIETGNGNISWGADDNTARAFMESLLIKDPARTLDMATAGSENASKVFDALSSKWATRDLVAYTEWVNRQTNTRIRDGAAGLVANELSSRGHFQEAAEWAMSVENPNLGSLCILATRWNHSNHEEASAWVESADLPESVKTNLRDILNRNE